MWRVFVYPTLSLFLFNWHQWDTDLLFFLTTYNKKKKGSECWPSTTFLCLMWQSGESLSQCLVIPAGPGGGWGRGGRLPDNKTNSDDDGCCSRSRKKRWCSSNQSMERPRGCWFIGTLPFPRQNTIRRQTRCENNPISTLPDLQRPAHIWRCSKGCDWFII